MSPVVTMEFPVDVKFVTRIGGGVFKSDPVIVLTSGAACEVYTFDPTTNSVIPMA
jgi:hypothetical protein